MQKFLALGAPPPDPLPSAAGGFSMRESYPQVSELPFQILLTFATTYLCKSGFSALVHIKNEIMKSKES